MTIFQSEYPPTSLEPALLWSLNVGPIDANTLNFLTFSHGYSPPTTNHHLALEAVHFMLLLIF